jgi:predicted Fe-S protein YdhL (DUF1289 family)
MQISAFHAVLSPCVGVCDLRDDGLCRGCLRTVGEIASWSTMGDAQRLRVMEALPARESRAADEGT